MNWFTADLVRALSAPAVLLILALGIAYAGFRDRNARIREARETAALIREAAREAVERAERETGRWREAFELSEGARERQAEGLREALEVARTATMAVEGLRQAMHRTDPDGGR